MEMKNSWENAANYWKRRKRICAPENHSLAAGRNAEVAYRKEDVRITFIRSAKYREFHRWSAVAAYRGMTGRIEIIPNISENSGNKVENYGYIVTTHI